MYGYLKGLGFGGLHGVRGFGLGCVICFLKSVEGLGLYMFLVLGLRG